MLLLSVESESGSVLTYRLAKTQVTVGSSSRNDVVVRAPGLAERHLVIYRNKNVFTFVTVDRQMVVLNGERRSRGVLNPGDKLRIGAATLIFRGGTDSVVEVVEREAPPRSLSEATATVAGAADRIEPDPVVFAEARTRLLELFGEPHRDRLRRVVTLLRETFPGAEVAILAPGEGDAPVALASHWSGELPRIKRQTMSELAVPGRFATVEADGGRIAIVGVVTPQRELVAFLAARPAGALGDEGISLMGEIARHLGLQWREIEHDDSSFTGWELEARHRLEALFPGSSQAVQVLRAGILAAAHGNEAVLICGAEGVGKTEVARVLATLGPVGGRPVVVFEGRGGEVDGLRTELYGSRGLPTLSSQAEGLVGRAQGGELVMRNADRVPPPLQAELAALISAQKREPLSATSIRWVLTCDEDPLALVQKGRLVAPLFMVFAQRMLRVPRLSERREDLPLLIAALLRRAAAEQRKTLRGITLECLNLLLARPFPGEMAELVGEINRLVTATANGEMVRCDTATASLVAGQTVSSDTSSELLQVLAGDNLKEIVPAVEQHVIDRVMRRVRGNQSEGSRLLGISRGALIAKLKDYNIPDYRYLRRRREKGM
jgi:DNA-binding NtrC family response regulator